MTRIPRKNFIIFDTASKEHLLQCFEKSIDAEGYIVESNDPSQRVITPEGNEILFEDFGGIRKGSEIFFKNDLPSLIELVDIIE